MVTNITPGMVPATCPVCGASFTPARRSQRTCTEACKKKLARFENRDAKSSKAPRQVGLYQNAQNHRNAPRQVIENTTVGVPVFHDLDRGVPLTFERINEITWRMTDGVKIRHSGGRVLSGSDQPRSIGWLTDIGWAHGRQAWVARIGDLSYGPTSFAKARKAAVLMAHGGFEEPVQRVKDGPTHLRVLVAMLSDGEAH